MRYAHYRKRLLSPEELAAEQARMAPVTWRQARERMRDLDITFGGIGPHAVALFKDEVWYVANTEAERAEAGRLLDQAQAHAD